MTRKAKPADKYGWENDVDAAEYLASRGFADLSDVTPNEAGDWENVVIPSIQNFTAKDAAALLYLAECSRKSRAVFAAAKRSETSCYLTKAARASA
jgi:hypothetical protein